MFEQQIETNEDRTVAISLREIKRLGGGSQVKDCTGAIYTVDANHRGRLVMSHVANGKIYVDNVTHKDASRFLRFLIVAVPLPDPIPNRRQPTSPARNKQTNNIPTTAASIAPDAQPEAAQSLPDTITQTKPDWQAQKPSF